VDVAALRTATGPGFRDLLRSPLVSGAGPVAVPDPSAGMSVRANGWPTVRNNTVGAFDVRGNFVVRLTCLLRRKAGLTPAEFHEHWRNVHGPLIAASQSGHHVVRYEQHPRPLPDYHGDDDPGFDGVTVQWFLSMEAYKAHMDEPDFPAIWQDIESFLDTDQLHFILTEDPRLVMGDEDPFPLA
jgi:uncharacterized protein (TIGR02118 family)